MKLRNQRGGSLFEKVSDCHFLKQGCSVWNLTVNWIIHSVRHLLLHTMHTILIIKPKRCTNFSSFYLE